MLESVVHLMELIGIVVLVVLVLMGDSGPLRRVSPRRRGPRMARPVAVVSDAPPPVTSPPVTARASRARQRPAPGRRG